jgi:hypothetical protein
MVSVLVLIAACGDKTGDTANESQVVLINEIMSSNLMTFEDNGTYPDWLELYNPGNTAVDLTGWTLSDSPGDPGKWTFSPGATVPAKGFLVVICDSDTEEGLLHTSFDLQMEGEFLGLSTPIADGGELMDSLDFPAVGSDFAYGRLPDGDANWEVLWPGTPGDANRRDEQPPGGAR